jgi:hypothetical protein
VGIALVRDTVKTLDTALTTYLFGKPTPKRRTATPTGKGKPT